MWLKKSRKLCKICKRPYHFLGTIRQVCTKICERKIQVSLWEINYECMCYDVKTEKRCISLNSLCLNNYFYAVNATQQATVKLFFYRKSNGKCQQLTSFHVASLCFERHAMLILQVVICTIDSHNSKSENLQ